MVLHNTWGVLMLVLSFCGQVHTGEIIGGHKAGAHSRPYMVLLKMTMWNDETRYCDGFLISDEFVVTAAHCQARTYYVYVGLHKFINDQTPKGIQVSRAIPHENFDNKTGINDLMLLQLSEKVNFTNHVKKINLARRGDHLPQCCIVSGWGYGRKKQKMASKLREVTVTLVNVTPPTEHHVYSSPGNIGPSNGDSGGPLVCEGEVAYGVVSLRRCLKKQCFKEYTKIPDYLGWIESHLRKK